MGAVILLASITGWYLIQRMIAGNAYAQTTTGDNALRYFKKEEFGKWWPLMSTDLLDKLDEFRHRLGVAVMISPAAGSLGRELGLSTSQHNIDLWGEVRAVDVMFSGVSLERAYAVAKEVGFTGIGAYPDWQPMQGMHLDVRYSLLASWSGILEDGKQIYASIQTAFA